MSTLSRLQRLSSIFEEPSWSLFLSYSRLRRPFDEARKYQLRYHGRRYPPIPTMAPSRKRLQKERDESAHPSDSDPEPQPKPKRKKRKFKDTMEAQKHNPWVEYEAAHSGEERSVGGSDDELIADSSDREFVQELPETQVSASYDQAAIYRQSLLSQAPASRVPVFAKRPLRRGAPQYNFASPSRRRHIPSSSPDRHDEPDEYIQGSFVVDDDADISYMTSLSD